MQSKSSRLRNKVWGQNWELEPSPGKPQRLPRPNSFGGKALQRAENVGPLARANDRPARGHRPRQRRAGHASLYTAAEDRTACAGFLGPLRTALWPRQGSAGPRYARAVPSPARGPVATEPKSTCFGTAGGGYQRSVNVADAPSCGFARGRAPSEQACRQRWGRAAERTPPRRASTMPQRRAWRR